MAVLRVVNVVLGGVLVGGMVMELALILPALRQLPPSSTVTALQVMGPRAWRYLPVCGFGSTVTAVALLVLAPRFGEPAVQVTTAGAALSTAGMLVNLTRYLPVERRMRGWSREAPPPELPVELARATRIHVTRTVLFGAGFVCYAVAAVLA